MIKTAKAQIANGTLQGNVGMLLPTTNPLWDPNDPGEYASLTRSWELVKFGLENDILKAVNWVLMYNFKQGQHESPTDFVDKLLDRAAM